MVHIGGRRVVGATLAGVLVLGALGCSGGDNGGGDDDEAPAEGEAGGGGEAAVVPGDDWVVDDPADHGMDAATLDGAREYAFAEGMNTQGVVVVHDGAIVAEWYDEAAGAGPDSWAASWSVAK